MALPEKTPSKSCKEHEQEVKKQEEVELNIKETKVKNEEKDDEITAMNKQVILTENENEKKENDKTSSLVRAASPLPKFGFSAQIIFY